jgi:hypothetical protein
MDSTALRRVAQRYLSPDRISELADLFGVVERDRKKNVEILVQALVEGAGKSGRQADALTAYLATGTARPVVRGCFYAWFGTPLAMLLAGLANGALMANRGVKPRLPKRLRKLGVSDIVLFDSETLNLSDELEDVLPGTSGAALKIHKLFSVGRNNVIDYFVTPAREHDAVHLHLGPHLRGCLLVVDLGHASHDLVRRAREHGIHLVLRLKSNWRPHMMATVDELGDLVPLSGKPLSETITDVRTDELFGDPYDWDVELGGERIPARLVGVPGEEKYHFCITTLGRDCDPAWVCSLYRLRWEIECDNKRDKTGSGLTRIEARKLESVLTLVHASMLRTIIVNALVETHLRARRTCEPPLHGLALSLALSSLGGHLAAALLHDRPEDWRAIARAIHVRAHDPNWRRRPSRVDRARGIVAAPGRPKRARLADCPMEAAPYRWGAEVERRCAF